MLKTNYKIAVDIDDVLAEFYPAMCRRFNMPCKRINIWDAQGEASFVAANFRYIEFNRKFWMHLNPLSRPEDINFEFDYYITSSPQRQVEVRKEWLMAMGFPNKKVISTPDKVYEMRRLGVSVLIDDKPKTLEEVKEAGFIPIQFVPPYMSDEREDLNIIRHLSQVPDILNNLK